MTFSTSAEVPNRYRRQTTTRTRALSLGIVLVACSGSNATTNANDAGGGARDSASKTSSDSGSIPVLPPDGTTLASGQNFPSAIATDGKNIYWVNNLDPVNALTGPYAIMSIPKAGGTAVTLAQVGSGLQPTRLVTDGTNVYFPAVAMSTGGQGSPWAVMSVPVTGGAPVTLDSSVPGDDSFLWDLIAIDDVNVYYIGPPVSAALYSVPKIGGSPVALASLGADDSFFNGLAADGTNIYAVTSFGSTNSVESVSASGVDGGIEAISSNIYVAGATQQVNGGGYYGCAVDGELIYWLLTNIDNGTDSVVSIPTTGGTVVTLGSASSNRSPMSLPTGILVDETNVYWTTGNAIVRLAKVGGVAVTLAVNPTGVTSPFAIDSTSVYWTEQPATSTAGSGSIRMVLK